ALHGVPGSYRDFSKMMEYFQPRQDIRLIAPNMPDFSLTHQTGSFWHSAQERAQLTRDFLVAIKATKIDLFVVHSAGIHQTSYLWTDHSDVQIKSQALLSPPWT